MSNHPVGPRLESSLDQVFSLRKHEGEGDQTLLRGGLQAPGPRCERMDRWGGGEGRGAGEGPVTKVERRRLPERSFAQDRRPFSGNKLWAPNCLCRLYLRYASAAAATDFLLQDPRGGNEFERTRRASMVLRPEKRFQVFHYLLLSIFFFKQHFKRCVYTVLCCWTFCNNSRLDSCFIANENVQMNIGSIE